MNIWQMQQLEADRGNDTGGKKKEEKVNERSSNVSTACPVAKWAGKSCSGFFPHLHLRVQRVIRCAFN